MVTTANSSTTILGTDLSKRQYGLDIMRAAAIMFVVVGHQLDLLPSSLENIVGFFVLDGVNIFFVLSGFLIGGILIRTINRSFGARDLLVFWVNRWMRTLPPYYIVLTLLLCLYALFNIYLYPAPLSLKDTFKYYFFVQGLAWIMPNFFSESWSLCVEEWFYLITPAFLFFLCFFLKIKPKRSLLIVAASIIAGVTAYRFFRHYTLGLDWNAGKYHFIFFYKQVVTRLDAIMYGILGAYTAYYHAGFWKKCKNIAFLLGVIITLADHCSGSIMQFAGIETPCWFYTNTIHFSLSSIGFMLMLPLFHQLRSGSGVVYRLLTYISLISYSLYLVHYTLVKYVIISEFVHAGTVAVLAFYWLASFCIATLMYRFIEKPMMEARPRIVGKLKK